MGWKTRILQYLGLKMKRTNKPWKPKILLAGLILLILAIIPGLYEAKDFGKGIKDTYVTVFQTATNWDATTYQAWGIWGLVFTLAGLSSILIFFKVHPVLAILIALLLLVMICIIVNVINFATEISKTVVQEQKTNTTQSNVTIKTGGDVII
jgi:uncharacterized protein YxeA